MPPSHDANRIRSSHGANIPGPPWRIWIDTGGTFTDCVARAPDGALRRAKVLSTGSIRARVAAVEGVRRLRVEHPPAGAPAALTGFFLSVLGAAVGGRRWRVTRHEHDMLELDAPVSSDLRPGALVELGTGEPAPVLASRLVTGTAVGEPLPAAALRLATTRGTNALLERRLTPAAFFVSQGFADLLVIGDQRRPDLFALDIRRPAPHYHSVVQVTGRLDAQGRVLTPLDLDAVRPEALRLLGSGVWAAAIALLHSWRNPAHEQELAGMLRAIGFRHVSCSADLSPRIKVLPRAQTAVINAALSEAIDDLLDATAAPWPPGGGRTLHVMTSAGGLVRAGRFAPKDSLLSGPAAGVAGAAEVGRRAGLSRIIAFDMGGTSTDAARIDGEMEYTVTHRVGDAELMAPALAIESVAAGGGSICDFDTAAGGAGPVVGPRSAGAAPGPACYGAGGPLTLTDVNLLLGRLDPTRFGIPIEPGAAARAFDAACRRAAQAGLDVADRDAVLEGFLEIANERMAQAIRRVSVRRGYDPARYALVAFGGAGGQHACAVAARLGITSVLVPRDCSLLSALGLRSALLERIGERQVLRPLHEFAPLMDAALADLAAAPAAELIDEGAPADRIAVRRRIASLRYTGQDHTIEVEYERPERLRDQFEERSRAIFGHAITGRPIEVESLRVVVACMEDARDADQPTPVPPRPSAAARQTRARFAGRWVDAPIFDRDALAAGQAVDGPALILEERSATVVEPEWRATVAPSGDLLLTLRPAPAMSDAPARSTAELRPAIIRHELLASRLVALAEEMGEMLRRTALSTNVKERLDFSCALLDAGGELVVSAPHIPVHLGALGLCVRRVLAAVSIEPGDVVVTNHPAWGGSHLPDVTLVAPAFDASGRLLGFVACRAHHAEIGGTRPGSMPPDARTLDEEGVVIPPMHLVKAGRPDWDGVRRLLTGGAHPTRAVEENLADLAAQLAAVRLGAEGLARLAKAEGTGELAGTMRRLKDRAEARLRSALSALPLHVREALGALDDGSVIRVSIQVGSDRTVIDFAGTSGVHPGNLNAPLAVVQSAVMYVMRLLIGPGASVAEVPLNDGLVRPIDLRVPEGLLNPAFGADRRLWPAVAGGNVETSQQVVNLLVRALGLGADSQGTMNNLLLGDRRRSYYETVAGGAGAGPGFHGAAAVHTHMTNTAITEPEILEHRYPVRLDCFAIRGGSGGAGRWRGGDGVVRQMTFLEPLSLSLLTQHRTIGPAGMAGGGDGAPGRQRLRRADGSTIDLPAIAAAEVGPGDTLILETPGGGGWGAP